MPELYANPPLIEAVCDFRFEPGEPWDATVPGRLYTKLEREFPKRLTVRDFAASIEADEEQIRQLVTPLERTRFLRDDEAALVQVSPNNLTVHHLKPYPGWAVYRPMIERALGAYIAVAAPRGFQRIGLRYINRIEIPDEDIEWRRYLDFYPHIGKDLPSAHGDFLVVVTFPHRNGSDGLRIRLSGPPTGHPDAGKITLDLDYFLDRPGDVPLDGAMGWVEEAHARVEEGFEGSIKPPLRQLFRLGGQP